MGVVRKVRASSAPGIITIGEAYKIFESENYGKAASTLRNYKQSLGYFLDFCEFDYNTDVTKIKKDLVTLWINSMITEGIKSDHTINHYIRDVRRFLYWCSDEDREYFKHFRISEVNAQEREPKIYNDDEMDKLLKKPKSKEDTSFTEWRCWIVAKIGYDIGLRAGSLIAIKLEDINLQQKRIHLRHTKTRDFEVKDISTETVKALREYISLWRKDKGGSAPLLCSISDEELTYNALKKSFDSYCRKRGCLRHSLHSLRHTCATDLARTSGGNGYLVQKVLGHKSQAMTSRYIELTKATVGDYDKISPAENRKETRGSPKRKIRRSED